MQGERRGTRTLAFLFDATGRPLGTDMDIPAAVQAAATDAARNGGLRTVTGKDFVALAQPVAAPAGLSYIAAVGTPSLPTRESQRWQSIVRSFSIRMAVALLFGGIICYILAWRLTAPIRRLRTAAQRLASGDLSARVGETAGEKGDEVADLGRDLDRMAERIEGLIESQKRLVRDVSHELRSPLARFNVALGLARQHCSSTAPALLQHCSSTAPALLTLILTGSSEMPRDSTN